jgi:NACHT domain.
VDPQRQAETGVTVTTTNNQPIFWINGSAGTGKTTIAYTVAEACRTHGILGASFFCSRDDADCSNPKLIFTTIAYQLGQLYPPFRDEVSKALKSNPDIGYSSVAYQLDVLIVKPLCAVRDGFPPTVIVLDALDECKESDTTSVILSSLSLHVTELSPLKVLITSRPEQRITSVFKSNELSPATRRLILHEIQLDDVLDDIERYLVSNLTQVWRAYGLDISQRLLADIRALACLSSGLFIFAATSVKFIDDRNYSDPQGQLSGLVHNAKTGLRRHVISPSSSRPIVCQSHS